MTPKEKAKDLVDKMQKIVIDVYSDQFEKAKNCALIAVDLVLNDVGAKDWEDDGMTNSNYWQDVKSELNTLTEKQYYGE